MGVYTHSPTGDYRNDGWSLVGSGVSALWQALGNTDDTKYVKCPASKGGATVNFPIDLSTANIPDGAVIVSVTVNLRCSTGTGTPAAGQAPSLTVNTLCSDDPSRYTTRVIYPTSTITDIPVATYKQDALNFVWDNERLNHLLCRIFSYCSIFDLIRCHRLWCQITYRVRPTVTVTAPTGTVLTPSPVISWTYNQTDGDPQVRSEYKLYTAVQQAAVSFNPETTPPTFYARVNGDVSSITLPTSINPDSYWVYVRSYSSFGAKSVWVGRQFAVSGPSPGTPGIPDPTGIQAPGVGVITVVPDSANGSASLTLRDTSNLLSVQAADFEGSADGTEYSTTNCAFVQDSSVAYSGGTNSQKMTASSAADMSALTSWVELSEGVEVTARAQMLAAVTSRSTRLKILFYDASFASVGGTITGSSVADSTSTWTEITATGTSPTGAVYAKVSVDVLSPANAEVHNVDRVGLLYGTNTPWSNGGHMSRNLLSSWYATAEDPVPSGQAWSAGSATSTAVAVAPGGTGVSGAKAHSMTYVGLSPTLAFRATGSTFTSPTSGSDYTLNKPVGTTTGDLMVAVVSSSEYGTITPPAGWDAVNSVAVDDGTTDAALYILKRTATASEPTSWTDGSLSINSARRFASVTSYSGAADASEQFLAEGGTATGNDLPLWLTGPVVNNTDPNAWRISAHAFNDNVTGGTMVANTQAPSTIPQIAYVGRATAWKDTGGSSSYVINKPSGTISGDLMVATLGVAGNVTVTAPTGWTIVRQSVASGGPYTHAVLKRTAGGSEPASWTGSVSGTINKTKVTEALAYRNCADASLQFIAENITTGGGATSITTPSVTNTNSLAWRIVSFGSTGSSSSPSWSENEVIERCDDNAVHSTSSWFSTSYDSTAVAMSDSNGSVGTGAYSKVGTANASYYSAAAWIGIIKPLGTPPTPVANSTQRAQSNVGSSTPWLATGVFDSNGTIAAGSTSVTGIFTPGSGTDKSSAASWVGIIKPAVAVRSGYAVANMATTVDVSSIDSSVLGLAGNKVSVTATFLGSTAGTPYLTANFYRANVLLNSLTAQGSSFGTTVWAKSSATFDIPATTTRMSVSVSVSDRNVSDVVYFDRVGLSFGDESVWRNGTGIATHPVWAIPEIQYADDDGSGYTDWQTLPGLVSNPPSYDALSGLSIYVDHTMIPLYSRKYRARTVSYGLAGDRFVSGWGPDSSEVSFVAQDSWLKDITNEDNNVILKVKWGNIAIGTTNTTAVFQPLGEALPIVLSEGYKGDSFTLPLTDVGHDEWIKLKNLIQSGKTLFLQTDTDNAWWVRPIGDLSADILPTNSRSSKPLREVKVTFTQVKPEL